MTMTMTMTLPTRSSTLPAPTSSALSLLGPPPLNPGDDPAGYATLLARLASPRSGPATSSRRTACARSPR
jgi:hypothetical protein